MSLEINSTPDDSKVVLAVGKTQTLNHTNIASLHCPIRISHSVIEPTHECIIETLVSSVDNLRRDAFIASNEPLVSAFNIIFNCFKFHALILDISKSNPEADSFFCFSNNSLYSKAFTLATSELLTTCNISQPSTTLSKPTIKTGSPGLANLTF
jgi:hypothetical protein